MLLGELILGAHVSLEFVLPSLKRLCETALFGGHLSVLLVM